MEEPDAGRTFAERYRALHAAPDAFIAGGYWDAGSAMLPAHAGLPVLETSSAGVMFARGLPDGDGLTTRELMLENARSIAAAVCIPVTADLRMVSLQMVVPCPFANPCYAVNKMG